MKLNKMEDTIIDTIGNTPIVRVQELCPNEAEDVYIKLEEFNPGGSIKHESLLKWL